MSGASSEIVRFPLAVEPTTQRRVEERLALRFPAVVPFLAGVVWKLPRGWKMRQWILSRALRFVYEASSRGDYEAMVLLFSPDGKMIPPPEIAGLGWEPPHGREERARFQQRWREEWGQFRFEPEYWIDLGDRLLIIGSMRGSGLSSGAEVGSEWANLFTISGGLAIREEAYSSHAEAFKAAGLSM